LSLLKVLLKEDLSNVRTKLTSYSRRPYKA
jgi:hypothetical protein